MDNPQATIATCDAFKVVHFIDKRSQLNYDATPDEFYSCYRAGNLTMQYFLGELAVPRVGLLAAFFELHDAREFAENRAGNFNFVVLGGRAYDVSEAPDTACMATWPHWRDEADVSAWWADWFKNPMHILNGKTDWYPDNLGEGSLWCASFEVDEWAWGLRWDNELGYVEHPLLEEST